ncbi:ABC transporter permease [Actinospica sp.]|jgi:peptide/nickel transport system permease protein|uniref:ABC transporter permease n=1 Tax=Actinospica sp. TaxID=1872142 RepID=UPI002BC00543|nr:ABC transporter permease [Actinospica sp.]HWG26560.1 ABC transporter permease [Actinospica sp.]
MLMFIVRRLFAAVGLLLVVTLATFFIFYILPQWGGESIQEMARQYVGRNTSPAALQGVIDRLGFDKPFFVQYFDYVKGIVVGTQYSNGTSLVQCNAPCLGYSFRNYTQVWPTILQYFPVTLSLAIGGGVLWLGFGVVSGVISAVRKGSFMDRFFMGISLTGVSLPVYFVGPLLALVLAYNNNILQVPSYTPITQNAGSWFAGLLIPWFALAFSFAALYTRLTRGGMLDAMNEDFTRTARAKGLPERTVIFKHALRAAIIPIVTIFGLDLGSVLGGAVLVEKSLSLNGIGSLAITSIGNQDFPTVAGITLFGAFFIIMANLIVDVLYASLDPRVRVS